MSCHWRERLTPDAQGRLRFRSGVLVADLLDALEREPTRAAVLRAFPQVEPDDL